MMSKWMKRVGLSSVQAIAFDHAVCQAIFDERFFYQLNVSVLTFNQFS